MEAGPVALKVFRPLSSLWTPFQLTSVSGISKCGLGPLSGMVLVSYLEKTDSNCLFRIFALLGLSLLRNPSSFFSGLHQMLLDLHS